MPSKAGLEAGECLIKLSRSEREVLHLLLAIARERPEVLIDHAVGTAAAQVMGNHIARIQKKLPPRGSGTF